MTLWPIAGAVILAASAAAGLQTWRLESLRAEVATERMQAAVDQEQRTRTTVTAQAEADRNAATRTARTRNDLDRAAVAGDGLRDRAAALAAVGSAAAGQRCDASEAARVLADVLGSLEARGRAVAEYADRCDTALTACQQSYGALTK